MARKKMIEKLTIERVQKCNAVTTVITEKKERSKSYIEDYRGQTKLR